MENLILYSYQTLRYYSSSSNLSLVVVINATYIKYNAKNDYFGKFMMKHIFD